MMMTKEAIGAKKVACVVGGSMGESEYDMTRKNDMIEFDMI